MKLLRWVRDNINTKVKQNRDESATIPKTNKWLNRRDNTLSPDVSTQKHRTGAACGRWGNPAGIIACAHAVAPRQRICACGVAHAVAPGFVHAVTHAHAI